MNIMPTAISGVSVAETHTLSDHRGAFARLFCTRELASIIGDRQIVQVNQSRTAAVGAIRGMHFQNAPYAEMKMVRCLKGRVWDVAVDLRAGSPTFLQWYAQELSPESAQMLIIPEGCAHGFQVLEPECELLYLHTAPYCPKAEDGIPYNDPRVAITWPLPIKDLSLRDQQHSFLSSSFSGIHL